MKAANSVKVKHYAEIPPKHASKNVLALCGFRVPKKEATEDKNAVNCFMCWERLNRKESY